MSCIRSFIRHAFVISIFVVALTFIPNLPPQAVFEKSFNVSEPLPLTGKLTANNKLEQVEIWHKGKLHGPEAFADYNGELYSTLGNGDIVKLVGQHIVNIVSFGQPCDGPHEEKYCGRPLGMNFDSKGMLYVCDAYYGLFKLDVKTGKYEKLVAFNALIEGKKVKLANSVAVAANGDLFWTVSSSEFVLEDGVYDMLADGSGRLLHYNAKTKKHRVLIDNLHFANGVALSADESFVLVAETARSRIHRYYLKGNKVGQRDIFIDSLPGLPDNLKPDGYGGFLVPLVVAVDKDHPSVVQSMYPFPLLRKFLARLQGWFEWIFHFGNQLYPNNICQYANHFIGHFTSVMFMYPERVTILRLSETGKILDSIHSNNRTLLRGISEAHIFKDTLYLGSPFNDYIAKLKLDKIGWNDLIKPPKKEHSTTSKSASAPTTTKSETVHSTTAKISTTDRPLEKHTTGKPESRPLPHDKSDAKATHITSTEPPVAKLRQTETVVDQTTPIKSQTGSTDTKASVKKTASNINNNEPTKAKVLKSHTESSAKLSTTTPTEGAASPATKSKNTPSSGSEAPVPIENKPPTNQHPPKKDPIKTSQKGRHTQNPRDESGTKTPEVKLPTKAKDEKSDKKESRGKKQEL